MLEPTRQTSGGFLYEGAPDEARRHRHLVERASLTRVICDERLQRGIPVTLEAAIDQIGSAHAVHRPIGDTHHPVDPLAVEDPLTAIDGVTCQFDAFAHPRLAPGFVAAHDSTPLQDDTGGRWPSTARLSHLPPLPGIAGR